MTSIARNGNFRGGGEGRSGPKTKVPCVGGMDIFWNYTLAAEDFYVPTLP